MATGQPVYVHNAPITPSTWGHVNGLSVAATDVVLLRKQHGDESIGLGLSCSDGHTQLKVARVRGLARAAGVRVGDILLAVNDVQVQVELIAPRSPTLGHDLCVPSATAGSGGHGRCRDHTHRAR